ncbi:MAG: MMPL family transporter, partial [Pseudomonadota bacterium]
ALLRRIRGLDAWALRIAGITADDGVLRQYTWDNRFLFASLDDLTAARDALRDRAMKENPLYVSLDTPAPGGKGDSLDALRRRLDEARAKAGHPHPLVSADGHLQLIIVRADFNGGDLDRGARLAAALGGAVDATARESGPSVRFGVAGDVVLALGWSLTVGGLAAFAVTDLTIGHLNIASAFLSSIVVGNGINFGIILLGRYLEERRAGRSPEAARALAVAGTRRPTAAAAATAGAAYLSLAVTPFRGFRDFGIIGGVGMLCCWISAYTVLPAALAVLERRGWVRIRPAPAAVSRFERMLPRRRRVVVPLALTLFVVCAVGAWRYLADDPLETNLQNLASTSAEMDRSAAWMDKFDRAFGHGISGGFALAVARREEVEPLVAQLRATDAGKPERARLFSRISSIDDRLPADQDEKLQVLAEIRRLVDRQLRHPDALTADERQQLQEARPPEGLRALGDRDVPADLAWPYIERDGSRGRIVLANNGLGINSWNTNDLRRFARAVRGLGLPGDVLIGGTAFVFSDMLDAMERDGPRATAVAALGAVLVVLLLLGPTFAALSTLFCCALGTLALLFIASLLNLKVNFLDFVALPITIGIGVDYAVNIISRARADAAVRGARLEGVHTASAVALCSYTTVVGYGSLWFSANNGIRSFGVAAMLGEITCLAAALLVAPALSSRQG